MYLYLFSLKRNNICLYHKHRKHEHTKFFEHVTFSKQLDMLIYILINNFNCKIRYSWLQHRMKLLILFTNKIDGIIGENITLFFDTFTQPH